MKQRKNLTYTIFKIFSIVFMLVSILGIGRVYYFFLKEFPGDLEEPYRYYKDRIPKVYQKAGFTGEVSNFEHLWGLHESIINYTYTEMIDGEKVRYPISVTLSADESENIPVYSLQTIVDMYTDVGKGDLNDEYFFSDFFDRALIENIYLKMFHEDIKKLLEFLNIEEITISYYYNPDEKENMGREIKSDIASAMEKGGSPILAIRQLDPFKYIKLGYIRVTISADFKGKSFEDYLERIDKRFFKPGYYEIYFTEEEKYSEFFVNEQLEWKNITPTD